MTYITIDVGDRTSVVELLRQIQPGPGMSEHLRVLESVADAIESAAEHPASVDIVRELRKVHDVVEQAADHLMHTDIANACRHMAREVHHSPLTVAARTSVGTLAGLIDRLDPPADEQPDDVRTWGGSLAYRKDDPDA